MRALMFKRKQVSDQAVDPAPSRWSWRVQRLMLTPGVSFLLRAGMPFAVTLAASMSWLSIETNRDMLNDWVADARSSITERPEFLVNAMSIDGAKDEVARAIRDRVAINFPVSSFDLDIALVRSAIEEMDPIAEASVRIKPGGVLEVGVVPRIPAVIWRSSAGLTLLDRDGERVADIPWRGVRSDLPVIAGEGAADEVVEALHLFQVAQPLGNRVRGLVRVGERRWDLVLDREQRISLPSDNPDVALERALALNEAQDVLARDVRRIDLRLGQRATVQMEDRARDEWRRIRLINMQSE